MVKMVEPEFVEEINQDNLYLRKIQPDDAPFLFESLEKPNVNKYLSLGPLTSVEHAKKLIKKYQKYWKVKTQFNYVIELRGPRGVEKIGNVSLWNISWLHKRAEIGLWMVPSHWNKGLAKKVLELLKIIAFVHLHLNRLEAHIATENERSYRLFKKVGFKQEGLLEQYLFMKGIFKNAYLLAYVKSHSVLR